MLAPPVAGSMYDFDKVTPRRGTDSEKWDDCNPDVLPMWIADMDFPVAPFIIDAIQRKVDLGVFGYPMIPDRWFDAYVGWWQRRHGFTMKKEWLFFANGVVPAIASAMKVLTSPGDKVVVMSPVYNSFFRTISENGRVPFESRLDYTYGDYALNLDDLRKKLEDPRSTMLILCNPHNPIGKVWDADTLRLIADIAWENGVVVIADEIHCEHTDPGVEYTPFASVSDHARENCIMCVSPTKAFNMAGLKTAAVCIPNDHLRDRVATAVAVDWNSDPNVFAVDAAVAAYTHGDQWIDEFRLFATEFIESNMPELTVTHGNATYLMWIGFPYIPSSGERLSDFFERESRLFLSNGGTFGTGGETFLRLNLACPRSTLEEGLGRLLSGCRKLSYRHTPTPVLMDNRNAGLPRYNDEVKQ